MQTERLVLKQPVRMTTVCPPAGERCIICHGSFNGRRVIGHTVKELGNTVYCLVDASCLKTHMLYSKSTKCPSCQRNIDASTVFSVSDLTQKYKFEFTNAWAKFTYFMFLAALAGMFTVKLDVLSGDCTIYTLASKALLSGSVASLPALTPNPICTTPKVAILLAGSVAGFVGGASAVLCTSMRTTTLATLLLGVALLVGVFDYLSVNLFLTEQLKNNPRGVLNSGVFQ